MIVRHAAANEDLYKSVEKPLAAVPQDDRDFVVTRIRNLAEQPRAKGIKTLARDVYRLRIGRYRVIYKILEKDPMYAHDVFRVLLDGPLCTR